MEDINNIHLVIPVIAKRGRGRPTKPKAPIDDALPVVKKPKGRPPTAAGPVLNKEYFNEYYHTHLAKIVRCEICSSCISKQKLKKHQDSARCIRLSLVPFVDALFKDI